MLGRIGTIAIAHSHRRYQKAAIYTAVTGITLASSWSASDWATKCQQQQISQPWGNEVDILIPTLQAGSRVVRLIRTVVLIVMDYEIAKYKPKFLESSNQGNMEVEALEVAMEAKQKELENAQITYARGSTDSDVMSPEERRKMKEDQKRQMNQAATELAEIEEKIASTEGVSSKSQLHRKAAHRLLDLCRQNGGVYIKVGQHLANLDYLIPQEYIDELSSLFDDTPRSTYDDVCKVIEEDLGASVDEIFDGFEKKPIASASLAQVHVAYDKKTGKKLAVKVQHRGLRETSVGDIFAVTKAVGLIDRWFEDFTFGWIADEIAPHLPKELDFTREGRNAEKAAKNIAQTGLPCIIPKVIWSKTAPRVLTMEFEEGFKVTDEAAMEKSGLNKQYVFDLFFCLRYLSPPPYGRFTISYPVQCRTTPVRPLLFSTVIFPSWYHLFSTLKSSLEDGSIVIPIQRMYWFDPRMGYLKWSWSVSFPQWKAVTYAHVNFLYHIGCQTLCVFSFSFLKTCHGVCGGDIVDHGLYKDIDDTFRIRYARLWRSLMVADLKGIESSCHDMGIGQAYPLFAAMLTARPYDEIMERSKSGSLDSRTISSSADDAAADRAVIRGYAKEFMKDILLLLGTLPPQMLLLLKMNDCLRHIDFALGSPANTLVTAGKYASRAIYDHEKNHPSMKSRATAWLDYIKVMFRIHIYDFGIWLSRSLTLLSSSSSSTVKITLNGS